MFKTIKAMVLNFRKLSNFSKVDGKEVLTEDDKKAIKTAYGEVFLEQFEADLATSQEEGSEVPAENVQSLVTAISAHAAAVQARTAQLESETQQRLVNQDAQLTELRTQIKTLSESPEEDPAAFTDDALPRAEGKRTVMRVNLTSPIYSPVVHFLKTGSLDQIQMAAANETIDVADLKTEFGTFLSQHRNNYDMLSTLFTGFSSAKFFTTAMAVTEWRATQALITSVMQQFSSVWTGSGQAKIRPLKIINRHHKINFPIKPADVLESYAMYLYDEGLAPDQMPIVLYIWNQLIYPQLMQDLELRAIFKGKYVEPEDPENPGVTAPEDTMDGIETILVEGKASKKFKYYLPESDFDWFTASDEEVLAHMAGFVDFVAPILRRTKMAIGCSDEVYKRYKRAYKNIWGPGSPKSDDADFGSDRIDYSQQYLVPMEGMYGSPILFITPKDNLKLLRYKNQVPNVIKDVQKQDYVVKLFGEFWIAPGFAFGEIVYAWVPDGYDPKAAILNVLGAYNKMQQFGLGVESSGSAGGGL